MHSMWGFVSNYKGSGRPPEGWQRTNNLYSDSCESYLRVLPVPVDERPPRCPSPEEAPVDLSEENSAEAPEALFFGEAPVAAEQEIAVVVGGCRARRATPDDTQALRELVWVGGGMLCRHNWEYLKNPKANLLFVYEQTEDKQLVGLALCTRPEDERPPELEPRNSRAVYVHSFEVHPRYRGQGVGSRFCRELLAQLEQYTDSGFVYLHSYSATVMRFWRRQGFQPYQAAHELAMRYQLRRKTPLPLLLQSAGQARECAVRLSFGSEAWQERKGNGAECLVDKESLLWAANLRGPQRVLQFKGVLVPGRRVYFTRLVVEHLHTGVLTYSDHEELYCSNGSTRAFWGGRQRSREPGFRGDVRLLCEVDGQEVFWGWATRNEELTPEAKELGLRLLDEQTFWMWGLRLHKRRGDQTGGLLQALHGDCKVSECGVDDSLWRGCPLRKLPPQPVLAAEYAFFDREGRLSSPAREEAGPADLAKQLLALEEGFSTIEMVDDDEQDEEQE